MKAKGDCANVAWHIKLLAITTTVTIPMTTATPAATATVIGGKREGKQ